MSQMELVDLDSLVPSTHAYRDPRNMCPMSKRSSQRSFTSKGPMGMRLNGCFGVYYFNSWKTCQIGNSSDIWKKIWRPNGFVGSRCPHSHWARTALTVVCRYA
jgi:hypothetical protein